MLQCSKQEKDSDAGNSKGQTGADPRNGGHRPKERLLQVPYAVYFQHRLAPRVLGDTQPACWRSFFGGAFFPHDRR